jgi:hypothetical protein
MGPPHGREICSSPISTGRGRSTSASTLIFPEQKPKVFRSGNHRYSVVEKIGVAVGAETHDRTVYRRHVWWSCCPRVGVRFPLPDDCRSRSDLAGNDSLFGAGLFDLFQPDLPSRASTPDRCRQRISKPPKIVSGVIPAFAKQAPMPPVRGIRTNGRNRDADRPASPAPGH